MLSYTNRPYQRRDIPHPNTPLFATLTLQHDRNLNDFPRPYIHTNWLRTQLGGSAINNRRPWPIKRCYQITQVNAMPPASTRLHPWVLLLPAIITSIIFNELCTNCSGWPIDSKVSQKRNCFLARTVASFNY